MAAHDAKVDAGAAERVRAALRKALKDQKQE
jgi:hypothetical protein